MNYQFGKLYRVKTDYFNALPVDWVEKREHFSFKENFILLCLGREYFQGVNYWKWFYCGANYYCFPYETWLEEVPNE